MSGSDEGTSVTETHKKFTETIASITVELNDPKAAQQEESQQARKVARVKKTLSD
jgi:hypothetical protein